MQNERICATTNSRLTPEQLQQGTTFPITARSLLPLAHLAEESGLWLHHHPTLPARDLRRQGRRSSGPADERCDITRRSRNCLPQRLPDRPRTVGAGGSEQGGACPAADAASCRSEP